MVDVLHAEMGGIEMKWIEYTGDNKQIEEINRSESLLLKRKDGAVSFVLHPPLVMNEMDDEVTTHYLIGQPHPYADLIKIWADTGCPVWVKGDIKVMSHLLHTGNKVTPYPTYTVIKTTKPDWNIPGEYRLTPFED